MPELVATSPVTGEVLGTFSTPGAEQVRAMLERARAAQASWGALSVARRLEPLRELKNLLIDEMDEVVAAIAAATGKPHVEGLTGDLMVCVDMLHHYERHAEQDLAPEPRKGGLLYMLSTFSVEYLPLGVVAVFAPWNYPLQLALVPALSALIAGNAVLLKPSEFTPTLGALIGELGSRAGLPPDLLQVVQGGPDVGRELVAAAPDKIFFTGSVATGRRVMRAAAEHVVPVELELGGKDPMVVFADANLERAARGAVYGAFANAGQLCLSVERLYVERSIHDRLVEAVVRQAREIRPGTGPDADIGPMITERQLELVQAQIDDALARGARLASPRRREGRFLHPVVLTGVDHTMQVMQEETFGPVLPIMAFDDEQEAIRLANDTIYGLGCSVWTRDTERGARVARQIVSGSCAVNDVVKYVGNPHVPFGGTRQSGFGRYHGPEGLHAFSRQLTLMISGGRMQKEVNWFPYSRSTYQTVKALIHAKFSDRGAVARSRRLVGSLLGMLDRDDT